MPKNTFTSQQLRPTGTFNQVFNKMELERSLKFIGTEVDRQIKRKKSPGDIEKLVLPQFLRVLSAANIGASNSDLKSRVDSLFELLEELDKASTDLLAGSNAQIQEYSLELEALKIGTIDVPETSVTEIETQLNAMGKEEERVSGIQEDLEDRLNDMRSELAHVETELARGNCPDRTKLSLEKVRLKESIVTHESNFTKIRDGVIQNHNKMIELREYKRAVEIVQKGPPEVKK